MTLPVDFAIISALKVEREAVVRRLQDVSPVQFDDEPLTFYAGHVHVPGEDAPFTIVVAQLLEVGNRRAPRLTAIPTETDALTSRLATTFPAKVLACSKSLSSASDQIGQRATDCLYPRPTQNSRFPSSNCAFFCTVGRHTGGRYRDYGMADRKTTPALRKGESLSQDFPFKLFWR